MQERKVVVSDGTKCQKADRTSCSLMDGKSSEITCQQGRSLDIQSIVLKYTARGNKAGAGSETQKNQIFIISPWAFIFSVL